MVQLTLPRNSVVQQGKVWPKPAGATRLKEFRIYRWDPDDEANPRIDTYFVDLDTCQPMILDGLIWIVAAPERTAELDGFFPILGLIVSIDLVWAISYTLWPKKAPAETKA